VEKDYKGKRVIQPLGDGMPKKKELPSDWTMSAFGWQKLNVHVGFLMEENRGTWGTVLRDHEDKVVVSAWGMIDPCPNAKMAEGLAFL
jgi:hypothetical protein